MKPFWVADFSISGEKLLTECYAYELLERIPGAAELIGDFSGHLYRSPDSFEIMLLDGAARVVWGACSATGGIVSIRYRDRASGDGGWQLASFALLLSGIRAEDDRAICRAAQDRVVDVHRDTEFEPAFDVAGVTNRPLVASFTRGLPPPGPQRDLIALSDRCFGAAYFRWQRLV